MINFLPMAKIDLVVADQILEQVLRVLIQYAKTGPSGDGKVLVSDVTEAPYSLAI
jgi:nitrogen regulatory protein P-II 1